MPRPHEDIERQTLVDHRPGGAAITLAPASWCAIEIAHVAPARLDAGISTYETLIEKARTASASARPAVIFRNGRRVIALLAVAGHAEFRHLETAWDDHHLFTEHHTVTESGTLALYKVAASEGAFTIDPSSRDAYAFEYFARDAKHVQTILPLVTAAPAFRGIAILSSDDERASAAIYQFADAASFVTFRASAEARRILGSLGETGETMDSVRPVKTFG